MWRGPRSQRLLTVCLLLYFDILYIIYSIRRLHMCSCWRCTQCSSCSVVGRTQARASIEAHAHDHTYTNGGGAHTSRGPSHHCKRVGCGQCSRKARLQEERERHSQPQAVRLLLMKAPLVHKPTTAAAAGRPHQYRRHDAASCAPPPPPPSPAPPPPPLPPPPAPAAPW